MIGRWKRLPGLRGRLLISVVAALAFALVALVLAFNVVLRNRLSSEASGVAQARAAAEVAALRIVGNRIALPEAPDDRNRDILIWVFERQTPIEQPSSPRNFAAAAALARRAPASQDDTLTDTRLLALPVSQGSRRLGAVVAGVSLEPYEQSASTTLTASVILAFAVLLVVALAARWVIGRALRPVAQMTRQAAEWSEHDLDRRFAVGPPRDELTELAGTLDGLLERLAAALRHEQRLSAEISHELRTPLTNIVSEAQYALRHGDGPPETRASLEQILHGARLLGRTLDTLMAAARSQLDPRRATSDARSCAETAIGTLPSAWDGLDVSVESGEGLPRVGAEPELVERILAPLLENAARHARSRVQVTIHPEGDMVVFAVADDGPGVRDEIREAIFQPGFRGSATALAAAPADAGAGLGLALSRRLARTANGEVSAQSSDHGGLFVVRLPAA